MPIETVLTARTEGALPASTVACRASISWHSPTPNSDTLPGAVLLLDRRQRAVLAHLAIPDHIEPEPRIAIITNKELHPTRLIPQDAVPPEGPAIPRSLRVACRNGSFRSTASVVAAALVGRSRPCVI